MIDFRCCSHLPACAGRLHAPNVKMTEIVKRLKNPEKKTIDVYRKDTDYLDELRTTNFGVVSYADVLSRVIKVYKQVID